MPERIAVGQLTAIEERVRQYLVERAKSAADNPFNARVSYSDLCAAVDPDEHYFARPRFRGIGPLLGKISTFEHEEGRPLLSALVVHKHDRQAGDGFAELARKLGYHIQPLQERAFWRAQVEKVVAYWSGPGRDVSADDPNARALALLAKVSSDIQEVQRLLSAG